MVTSLRERTPQFGEELDLLLVELFKAKAPYETRKRGLLQLEKQWVRKAKTPTRRLAVQRIISKTLLTEAYGFDMPWREFGRWLRRLHQLGFQNLGMRVHVTCLYVQSLHLFPRQAREAWAMLEDVERRAQRLRRERPLRQEYLASIAHAKRAAQVPASHRSSRTQRASPGTDFTP